MTWETTDHSKIQVRCFTGIGYQVRWELPVPATRVRCEKCRKDLVPDKTGAPWKHACDSPAFERGYGYPRRDGNVRMFGTRAQAIAVAREELCLTTIPEQIASRVLSGIHTKEPTNAPI